MDSASTIQSTIDRGAHTVLVVDDNPATRYSTGRVIRAAGFKVAEAETGGEALAMADKGVSAVVLDVHLPDMDGFDVCRELRSRPATELLPIVHLSAAYVKDEDHVTGLNAGADGYMVHPVEPAVLIATLQALIRARAAEEAQRRSERRFRAIYHQAHGGIALIDAQGRFVDVNPAMLSMLGRGREDVIGHGVASLAPQEFRERVEREFSGLAGEAWRGEFPLVNTDGAQVHMQWSLSASVGRDVRVATAIDVSERHELERRRHEVLEREQAARAQAERHSRTKDDFIAVLSHELRTPLNAIIGWVHILKRRGATTEALKGLDAIERNVKTQARIISDILDVSRINSGKLQLDRQWIDPAELVTTSLASLSSTLEERSVTVETDVAGAHERAFIDAARYQQILWNLMTNAVKFSAQGGCVQVRLARLGDNLRLEVRDYGVGIKPEFLPHLFDRFSQSDSPGNRRQGGLGLGLSIVKHLVDLHGGQVGAVSAGPGHGTLMWVDLPVGGAVDTGESIPGDLLGGEEEPEASAHALDGVEVLLVEDDREAREMMAIVLGDRGATVRVAADFDGALEQLLQAPPHVIVSDIGLPGRDGYELARAVRAQEAGAARLPMIALTAFARPEDQRKSLEAGFDRHLAKPLKPHLLLGAIVEMLPGAGTAGRPPGPQR
ncbi:hybrid sensor histidine kinase/response regulator [Ramlibacter sp. Leaf400]|uniref:hybrid sensor histidine kinase/response regulator n=1 Tax=Ramlibacter sp. Leaf400 TaxID=1736365 RepID=UPI0006FF9072|nr:response regulator [Ramlibacter sp. Leaf400]KQT13485.1 histidine kinase [Ramlibacter sp. Leaf400]